MNSTVQVNNIIFQKYYSTANMEWRKFTYLYRAFEVSACGKVRNEHGRLIKGSLHQDGFRVINVRLYDNSNNIFNKKLLIHRMVAKCWIENEDLKPYVIHLNGDFEDNNAKNLAWATADEKIAHQKRCGKLPEGRKLTQMSVVKIKKMLSEKQSTVEAIAQKFGVSHTQIHRIKRGENWSDVIILI
jgi:hypothetical protein